MYLGALWGVEEVAKAGETEACGIVGKEVSSLMDEPLSSQVAAGLTQDALRQRLSSAHWVGRQRLGTSPIGEAVIMRIKRGQ